MTLTPSLITRRLLVLPLHLVGCAVLAVAADALLSGGEVTHLLLDSGSRSFLFAHGQHELLTYLGCACTLWASIVCLWSWQRGRARAHATRPSLVRVVAPRGAVLLETLLVLVPFLALTGGLMQVSINSIAGLLANLGAYQAARTAWIWLPEVDEDRSDQRVTREKVVDMARLAAASALAPVVPSAISSSYATNTKEVTQMRATLFAHFSPSAVAPYGSTVSGQVNAGLGGGIQGSEKGDEFTVALAFDAKNMGNRSVRKLTFAAHPRVTDITLHDTPTEVTISLTYNHYQAFPWFGYIVGSGGNKEIDGRKGYYLPIERSYTLPKQVPPT